MNKHIEVVKKWLNDPDSVSRKELKDNGDAAHAAARDADTDAEFREAADAAWAAAYAAAANADAADYCVKRYEELIND